jgi:hypothetical protein
MTAAQKSRRDRLLRERVHDTYKNKAKPNGSGWCPSCGVTFKKGRWAWAPKPADAEEHTCPACLRVRDRCPAGFVHIRGSFFDEHATDLRGLIKHVEEKEKGQHPLNRIMSFEREGDETIITTTDAHLARAIGEALHRAHEGELDYAYIAESPMLRVHWTR